MTAEAPLDARGRASSESGGGLLSAAFAELAERPRGGPAWLAKVRATGTSWLRAQGFPGPKDEAFRFTPTRAVVRVPYRTSREVPTVEGSPVAVWDAPSVRLHRGIPSALPSSPGLDVRALSEILASEAARLEGPVTRSGQPVEGFQALNDALFEDGLFIVAREGTRSRLHIEHAPAATGAPRLSVPRIVILAEPGSELFLLETRPSNGGSELECATTDVELGRGAKLEHVRIAEGARDGGRLGSLRVRQGADSRYVSRTFTFGGALTRESLHVTLAGRGTECLAQGLYTAGSGELVDHHTRIVHAEPHGTSREQYKGVLSAGGTAVFDGTIVVAKGASRTAAHQENRNLLLGEDAVVHAKPHLEIDTDDVKCSHGATVGRLDPAQLFYLRSRGIPEEVARAVLVVAFARELILDVTEPEVRALLESRLALLLPGGQAAMELA